MICILTFRSKTVKGKEQSKIEWQSGDNFYKKSKKTGRSLLKPGDSLSNTLAKRGWEMLRVAESCWELLRVHSLTTLILVWPGLAVMYLSKLNGIYIAHFLYGYIQMRFTITTQGWDRTSACKGACGSHYQTQPMNTCEQARPQHRGLCPLLFSNSDVGSLTSPTNLVRGDEGDKANGLTSPPNDAIIWTETRCWAQPAWSYQLFLRPWLLVRPGFEPMTSHFAVWRPTNWVNQAAVVPIKSKQPRAFELCKFSSRPSRSVSFGDVSETARTMLPKTNQPRQNIDA